MISITWWWGVRWPMVLASIGQFVTVPLILAFVGAWLSVAAVVVQGALGLVLAARPPRTVDASIQVPAARPPDASRTAVGWAWALTGSVLLVPSLLIGPLAPRLAAGLESPPPSPLAGPSIVVNLIALVLLPILAAGLAVIRRRGSGPAEGLAWVGLIVSALVLGQAVLSIGGVAGFEFSLPVGPAAAVATLGFGIAIARPAFILGVGTGSAVLAALAGVGWMTGAAFGGFASPEFAVLQASTLGTGMVVTVALGREFAIGAVPAAEPPPAPDAEPVHEVAEAVDTTTVTASIHRR
jgi:hypothetical protein